MLPDIVQHNTRFSVSGLGATEDTGVLSRSYLDLHPDEFQHEVVWNGTIACQQQKAEQKAAPPRLVRLEADQEVEVGSTGDRILDLFASTSSPLCARDVASRLGLYIQTVDGWLRLLSRGGLLVCADLEHPNSGKPSYPRTLRMYAAAKAKAA
jgi:DNA-binding transcriptional ArsR family regulator